MLIISRDGHTGTHCLSRICVHCQRVTVAFVVRMGHCCWPVSGSTGCWAGPPRLTAGDTVHILSSRAGLCCFLHTGVTDTGREAEHLPSCSSGCALEERGQHELSAWGLEASVALPRRPRSLGTTDPPPLGLHSAAGAGGQSSEPTLASSALCSEENLLDWATGSPAEGRRVVRAPAAPRGRFSELLEDTGAQGSGWPWLRGRHMHHVRASWGGSLRPGRVSGVPSTAVLGQVWGHHLLSPVQECGPQIPIVQGPGASTGRTVALKTGPLHPGQTSAPSETSLLPSLHSARELKLAQLSPRRKQSHSLQRM